MSNNKISKCQAVRLFDFFPGNISTRAAVSLIDQHISNDLGKVLLDFSDISFISRSFAHELMKYIEQKNEKIELTNLAPAVSTMFEMVRKAKASPKIVSSNIEILKLSDSAELF